MPQIVETCSCGCTNTISDQLREYYGTDEYLRCQRCGETLRQRRDGLPWLFFLLATAVAVWGWISVA